MRKVTAIGFVVALLLSPFHGLNANSKVYAAESTTISDVNVTESTTALTDADLSTAYAETSVSRVSVHDPSIVSDGKGTYYIFGSHMAWAKSTDLKNWTTFTNNINTDYATLFAKEFAWGAMGDSVYNPAGNMWAPDVIYNETLGKWCMYMSINGWSWNSSIVMLTADTLDGNWTYVGTVIYSGFTDAANNHDFTKTDYTTVTGDTTLASRYIKTPYTSMDGNVTTLPSTWNLNYGAHAIDPCVFYGQNGKLYMTYGSWSGGIYLIELDEASGLRDKAVTYTEVANTSDPYMGIKLAGGFTTSGEAPYVEYINGYYYLFVTNGGLTAKGGYNMRVYKSLSPEGPYTDVSGQSSKYTTATGNIGNDVGTRLMSYYKWNFQKYAQVAQGHNSAIIDADGKAYVVYHTRSNDGTEGHSVRVHQLFTTKNHNLVAAPFEYNGETVSPSGYAASSVVGSYEVILQKQAVDYANLGYCSGQAMNLNEDGSITGDYTGTWTMEANSPYVTLTIDGITYEGLFVEQTIEGTNINTMAFTVVGTNDVCLWGAKYPSPEDAIAMTKNSMTIASETYADMTLPTTGVFGATISWSSSNPSVLANDGKVSVPTEDTMVTLTATILSGQKSYQKNFTVLVHKAVGNHNEIQLLASAFINDPQDLSTRLDGSLSMANPYKSVTNLDVSKGVKIQFDVQSNGTNRVLATILSFMGNNGESGRLYFTPGSYLGYNAAGGWFDANMAKYAMVQDYIGTTKSTIELTLAPTGFEVYVNGVKAYDQSILSDATKGAGSFSNYYELLQWLNTTADTVYFGKGSWWAGAGFDEALCSISNVYFYGYLMPSYKLISNDGIQMISSSYVNNPQDLSTKSDGSLSMTNPFRTISNLDKSKGVKVQFDVQSTGVKNVLASILTFMGYEGLNGRLYFTPGSYLGYNGAGGWIDANLTKVPEYTMATDYIGDSKATVEINFTSFGFEVSVNGIKAFDQTILSDAVVGSASVENFDYTSILTWITTTADKVYFGKGSWWGGQAFCEISNVKFFGFAQEGSTPTVSLSETVTYDGTAKTPAVTVQDGNTTLVAGTDYTVQYSNNVNVGTATVTITGTGNYAGVITKSFAITAKDINTVTVALGTTSYIFDGSPKTPAVTVTDGTTTLAAGTDYTVAYTGNTNIGTATVTITGTGNYAGTTTKTFTIIEHVSVPPVTPVPPVVKEKVALSKATISLSKSAYTYDGTEKTPAVTVTDGTNTLSVNTDYTVAYTNNINAGTAKVTITGAGNYTGTKTQTFKINANDITLLEVSLEKSQYTYDQRAKVPAVTIKNGTTLLVEGTDYLVTYKNNKKPGEATVKITGKRNYTGVVTKTFNIALEVPTVKLVAGKKAILIKWSKLSNVTGYSVYMATSENGTYKKVYTADSSTLRFRQTGLTSKKTYYFKVVANVKEGNKTYSSESSAITKVRAK